MRIILVQAEIELAIRAYVLTQISVKDGQEVSIDFKNTRGEDGATAEINISYPLAQPAAAQALTSTQIKENLRKAQTASPAPAVEATVATSVQQAAPVEVASTTSEPEGENQKEEEVVDEADEHMYAGRQTDAVDEPVTKPVADPEDAPAPPKSLFANLTKPVNPKS